MQFGADVPDYLGRGGPHLHALSVARAGDGVALRVEFRMVLAGTTIEERDARAPESLADGLRSIGFAYRGPGKPGKPAPWLYEWEHPEALPSQVRVRIADAQGAWPDLVVALGGPIGAGSTQGRLMLGSDRFFDERSFDPDDIPGYLAGLP